LRERAQTETPVLFVRRFDDAETLSKCVSAKTRRPGISQWMLEQRPDSFEPRGRDRNRTTVAARADTAAGTRGEGDERSLFAARGAPGEVREISGEPD
jgi:hypothetical protein